MLTSNGGSHSLHSFSYKWEGMLVEGGLEKNMFRGPLYQDLDIDLRLLSGSTTPSAAATAVGPAGRSVTSPAVLGTSGHRSTRKSCSGPFSATNRGAAAAELKTCSSTSERLSSIR